jgi:hypothetical protein
MYGHLSIYRALDCLNRNRYALMSMEERGGEREVAKKKEDLSST